MNYWVSRNLKTQNALANKSIQETEKQLIKYYRKAMATVIADFEATYDKLLLTIGEGKQPTPADLYKLDKYWQAQNQMTRILKGLGDKQVALLNRQFTNTYLSIYNSLAIQGEDFFNKIDEKMAQQMINQVWCADGKNWSSRVWGNVEKLQETLNEELIHCVVAGKKTSQLKQLLQERFNVSYSNADMLTRTEISHIQNQAAQQRYKDAGIQEVEIFADKDERRCEVCGKLHKKKYPIGAAVPIPAHPNCRCSILPVIE